MLTSKRLWLLLSVFTLTCSTTCNKKQNPPPRISMINPFNQYLQDEGDTVKVTLHPNELPVELGYSFIVSDTGTVYEIGIRLPDSGNIYPVTLWDGATQTVLARQNIKVSSPTGFSYFDLTSTNAQVSIAANHPYVISVNMTPTNPPPAGAPVDYDFYDIRRTDEGNIFPMTKGYVTYQYEYTQTCYTPTFPANLSEYLNYINGIVDIGFSHTSQ
jgi:hypothetical protein